jgi:hypothetical protein
MKRKAIANLIAIVVIASIAAFSGCIEEEALEPTPAPVVTPALTPSTTPTPTVTPTVTPTTTSTPTGWTYLISATASQKANDITVTYTGGPAAGSVVGITVLKAGSAANVPYVLCEGTCPVGESVTFNNAGTPGHPDPVIVEATFVDGTTHVILDTNVIG